MRFVSATVLNTVTDASTQTSAAIDSSELFIVSAQGFFGDQTLVGSIKLQGSNDPGSANNLPGLQVPTHWNDITGTSTAISGVSNILMPAVTIAYRFIRIVVTITTPGSTTMTVNLFAQGF